MKTTLDPVSELASSAARAALPESVTVGAATLLPRGADPFVGTERPLLLGATRWTYVAPGGILVGGSPAALAAVLGFDLPARPTPVAAEDRQESDAPPVRWGDQVVDAARAAITTFTQAVANPIAGLVGLPPDCSPTQVSFNDNDAQVRGEAGLTPDAVVLLLHVEEHEVRLVVVVPGVFGARLRRAATDADSPAAAADDGIPVDADGSDGVLTGGTPVGARPRLVTGPLGTALSRVPLDLSLELGQARVPLSQVLHLRDGEVIELRQAIDAPVDLVSESTAVARGDLEVSDAGNLVLVVTSIPGRPDAPATPHVLPDDAVMPDPAAGDASGVDALSGADAVSGADAPTTPAAGADAPIAADGPVPDAPAGGPPPGGHDGPADTP